MINKFEIVKIRHGNIFFINIIQIKFIHKVIIEIKIKLGY
jgi:hypothetical protein